MNNETKKYVHLWIEKAEEDRLVVHQLVKADSSARGAIGFHCQQSAEKFLKAFLIFHGMDPERTHNIEFLLKKCSGIDNSFSDIDPLNLTDYGIVARYPGDFFEPSINEIHEFIGIVDNIRKLVLQKTS